MTHYTLLSLSLSLNRKWLNITILWQEEFTMSKEAKEEGPCGRGRARSGGHHKNWIHIWGHQVYIWCGARVLVGRDLQADHASRGGRYGLGRRGHICQYREIFTDEDCHQTRAFPMIWSNWLDSAPSRCNNDNPGECWKIGLCCI